MLVPEYNVWKTDLEAKVVAANWANAYANELWKVLHEVCKPFVGCKIIRADGKLMANFAKVIDALELPNKSGIIVYRNSTNYSLSWVVKVSQGKSTGNLCNISHYHEVGVYIGNMYGGILKDVDYKSPELRTDYTVEGVQQAKEAYKAAQEAADKAKAAIGPF